MTFITFAVETVGKKKKVEDVMPIATGHEKEELEAELEVILSMHFNIYLSMTLWYKCALPPAASPVWSYCYPWNVSDITIVLFTWLNQIWFCHCFLGCRGGGCLTLTSLKVLLELRFLYCLLFKMLSQNFTLRRHYIRARKQTNNASFESSVVNG